MEYIEIKIPVIIANDLADCIDVGCEGADHLEDETRKAIEAVSTDIRRLAHVKIADIEYTYKQLFGKG
jgi:hypothetical protein